MITDQITDAVRSVLGEFVSPEKAHALADALRPILAGQASAENARLRALLKRTGEALKPFATQSAVYDCEDVDSLLYDDSFEPAGGFHTVGQLRSARTVVCEIEEAIGHERP